MQGSSVVRSLPADLNPKVMEQIADSVGMDLRTLKSADAQPSSSSPTLVVPARGKPRSARPAKAAVATTPPCHSESPEVQQSPVAKDDGVSDLAEVNCWMKGLSVCTVKSRNVQEFCSSEVGPISLHAIEMVSRGHPMCSLRGIWRRRKRDMARNIH